MSAVLGLVLILTAAYAGTFALAYAFYRGRDGASPFPRPYVVVREWQKGLVYHRGRFLRMAPPGKVWTYWVLEVACVSVEEQVLNIEGRQMVSADHYPIFIGVTVLYSVDDPRRSLENSQDSRAAFFAEALGALQAFVASRTLLALLDDRMHIDALLYSVIAPRAEPRGFALKEVIVGDLSVPHDVLAAIGASEPPAAPDPFQKH